MRFRVYTLSLFILEKIREIQEGLIVMEEKKKKQKMKYTVKDGVATFVDSKGRAFTVDSDDAERVAEYTWCVTDRGYVVCNNVNGEYTRLHRFIMRLGKEDKYKVVDHIQTGLENRANNCKSNLRICSTQENLRNNNAKGYHELPNGKYMAYIKTDEKFINLGHFETEEHAKAVRIMAEKEHFGNFSSNKHLFNDPETLRLYNEAMETVKRNSKYNEYTINGDIVIIKASNANEEFIVDLADFEKIKDYTWCFDKGRIKGYIDGKTQTLTRHLLGLKVGDNKRVKFIDGDKLNFRRNNLQVIESKADDDNE